MKVLIFGGLGQDGFFLTDRLISTGHEVISCIRRGTDENRKKELLEKYTSKLRFIEINIDEFKEIEGIIESNEPDAICNFLAVSDVFDPWKNIDRTFEINAFFPIKVLKFIEETNKKIKFIQASSSLVFGNSKEEFIDEKTQRNPLYPYGISKNAVDQFVIELREKRNVKCSSVILFNHESERRNKNFFTKKVIKNAVSILNGEIEYLELGDLSAYRDMGCAIDYMNAISLILEEENSEDYVIGTGKLVQLEEFVSIVLNKLNLNRNDVIRTKESLIRNVDTRFIRANTQKIEERLKWSREYTLETLIDRMIQFELRERNARII